MLFDLYNYKTFLFSFKPNFPRASHDSSSAIYWQDRLTRWFVNEWNSLECVFVPQSRGCLFAVSHNPPPNNYKRQVIKTTLTIYGKTTFLNTNTIWSYDQLWRAMWYKYPNCKLFSIFYLIYIICKSLFIQFYRRKDNSIRPASWYISRSLFYKK